MKHFTIDIRYFTSNSDSLKKSICLFQEAIDLDSSFILAHANLMQLQVAVGRVSDGIQTIYIACQKKSNKGACYVLWLNIMI